MPEERLAPIPATTTTAGQILYASGPTRQLRRGRLLRLFIVIAVSVSVAVAAWARWGSGIRDRSRLLQVQRACGRFAGLAGQPVIPSDEGASRYDLTSDWRSAPVSEGPSPARYRLTHRPRCLDEFELLLTRLYGQARPWRAPGYGSFWATGGQQGIAFLHQLRSPAGEARLIIVSGRDIWPYDVVLHASVLKPATWGESAVDVSSGPQSTGPGGRSFMELVLPKGTRLFIGQADPNDPSHFTLPYTLQKRGGTIDGWLTAGGTIAFQVRDGPLTDPVP